jgi:hypothetical protein
MRLAVLLLALAGISLACRAAPAPDLYPIEYDGKWGYMDGSGRVVINPSMTA